MHGPGDAWMSESGTEVVFASRNWELLARFARQEYGPSGWFDLARQAEELVTQSGFERLLCKDHLRGIKLHQHQERAVLRVLREMRGRAILADEAGLGKTIEAGAIALEYQLRCLVKQMLVLTPASLLQQWQTEFLSRFNIKLQIINKKQDWAGCQQALASLDLAKSERHRSCVLERRWDLLIVDEAHRLNNASTLNYRFVDKLQSKYIILLTATPLQNNLKELYNLITLLRPGHLATFRTFKKKFMVDMHSPRNVAELRDELSKVMVRSTRAGTVLRLPQRHVSNHRVILGAGERQLYDRLMEYARSAYMKMKPGERNLLPLILLMRRTCSSNMALAESLERMLEKRTVDAGERKRLSELRDAALSVRQTAKQRALEDCLRRSGGKLLVFTDFHRTQAMLVNALASNGVSVCCLNGTMNQQQKESAIDRFRRRCRVMVSTEVGGEGFNMHFCYQMLNFDLPWNPMRLEQRVGRLHRLGQTEDVKVINLVISESIEEYMVYLLGKKIRMFEATIGELDMILAGMNGGFAGRLARMILGARNSEELDREVEEFGGELEKARRHVELTTELNKRLLGQL